MVLRRRGIAAAGLAAIFLVAWPPLAWLAEQPLEGRYGRGAPTVDGAQAIVVLSSAALAPADGRPDPTAADDTYERCSYAAWLYQRSPRLPVLVTGGGSKDIPTPLGVLMRNVLLGQGVPDSMVWVEDRAQSTYENALYSAEILRQKGVQRILLVTEAYHMARAEGCFRKQGLAVIPAPCRFHLMMFLPTDFIPGGGTIVDIEHTLHEYVGLGWYKVRGRI